MQSKIKEMSEQRRMAMMQTQKKTFTNYINSILIQADMKVDDLFVDLCSGVILLKLLELVSGRQLAPPCRGNMRVHHLDNINKCLEFLYGLKVHVESISASSIVDGNPNLTLGLVWTIILRFHIQDGQKKCEHSSEKSLLLWCQRRTTSYEKVSISNFSNSWNSGLAFNALLHSQCGELFNYHQLLGRSRLENLNHAFEIAEQQFNIPRLLDAEDVHTGIQDEKSIIAYVASYHNAFEKLVKKRGDKDELEVDEATDKRKTEQQLFKQVDQQWKEADRLDQLKLQQEYQQQQLRSLAFFCVFVLFLSVYIIKQGYFSLVW